MHCTLLLDHVLSYIVFCHVWCYIPYTDIPQFPFKNGFGRYGLVRHSLLNQSELITFVFFVTAKAELTRKFVKISREGAEIPVAANCTLL
jgi:hypothetical protein